MKTETRLALVLSHSLALMLGLGACASRSACPPSLGPSLAVTQSPVPSPKSGDALSSVEPPDTQSSNDEETDEAADADEAAEAPVTKLPSKCENGAADPICTPPRAFVDQACRRPFSPETALMMFQKDSPWTRVYINHDMDVWFAGAHSTKSKVAGNEEVIVLAHSASRSGIKVGSGGFDVMRWNGDCISVNPEEVSMKTPRRPTRASVPWKILDAKVRDALLGDTEVAAAEAARRKACKEDILHGTTSAKCTKATDALSTAIADAIGEGRVSIAASQGLGSSTDQ
jgi:hypothetical protein